MTFQDDCLRTLSELAACDALIVEIRDLPPVVAELADPDRALADIRSRTGLDLPDHPFRDHYFAQHTIAANWCSKDEPNIVGEFALSNLHRTLTEPAPELEDPTFPDEAADILFDLRIVDQEPNAGSGRLTGIRFANDTHDLWLYDPGQDRLELLDADYATYAETALTIKGAYGWQYLFADVDLTEPGLANIANNLTTTLALFPTLFPNHQYEDLHQRLHARL